MNTQNNSSDISQSQGTSAGASGCSMDNSDIEKLTDENPDALLVSHERSAPGGTLASEANQQNEAQRIKLLAEGDAKARAELAKHSGLSRSLQAKLLQDKDESVLVALARNLSLHDETQEKLANTGTPAVREVLAANPSLNEKQQNYLAITGSDEVKCKLAKNPSLIVAIQSLFAVEIAPGVREALAENPSLDKSCQPILMVYSDEYRQDHVWTMMPLASNPALEKEFYECLAEDEDSRIVASLAKNPAISDSLMKRFATSDIDEVRAGLACNASLPEPLQARLIAGHSKNVRENIARNSALKVAQQAQLAHVGNVDVRLALLDNLSLDEQIRMRVAASFTNHDLSSAESDLEYAEKELNRLFNEHHEALQKCIKSHGGFFTTSDEKIERLNRAADRIQNQITEVDRKIYVLEMKCRKIRALLELQPVSEHPVTSWPFPIPVISGSQVSHIS